jgi:flavin reductase (DIM6/NTAB) family NADH-FMN oxidoreductase RutF
VIGSLCVVTSVQGQVHQGFLTSSVSQATFSPPGIMLSLTREEEDAANLQVGDAFVLNILKEGRNLRRHFQGGAVSGLDQYVPIETDTAGYDCLILREALAYLECTIRDRIEVGDRWLIYAVVEQGHLLETVGVTAVQHRKSAA